MFLFTALDMWQSNIHITKKINNVNLLYIIINEANGYFEEINKIGAFSNKGFKFQSHVWNRGHDLLMTSMNLGDIAILKSKNADYRFIIGGISKSAVINVF